MPRRIAGAGIAAVLAAMLGRMGWLDWPWVLRSAASACVALASAMAMLSIALLPVLVLGLAFILVPVGIAVVAWQVLAWACRRCRPPCGAGAGTLPPAAPAAWPPAEMRNPP